MTTLSTITSTPIVLPVNFIPERLEHAIAVMEEVIAKGYGLNLDQWYTPQGNSVSANRHTVAADETAEQVHSCGTSACLMGWIALTKEWREIGGSVIDGNPNLNNSEWNLVKSWFGADLPPLIHNVYMYNTARTDTPKEVKELLGPYALVDVSAYATPTDLKVYKDGGHVNIKATPEQVLKVLQQIRDEGTITLHVLFSHRN